MGALLRLFVGAVATAALAAALAGPHVCTEKTRFKVNVTEHFLRNSTLRSFRWCLNVPPRCSGYTTSLVNDSRVIEKDSFKITRLCCPGFVEDEAKQRCVPPCPCIHGSCQFASCQCHPGWTGDLCDKKCGEECGHQAPPPTLIPVRVNGPFDFATTISPAYEKVLSFKKTTTVYRSNAHQNALDDLLSRLSIAVAISGSVIVAAIVIVAAKRLRKKQEPRAATVAVFTRSMFHAPLPDPPTIDSVTLTPTVDQTEFCSSPLESQCFEAHVVCRMNFPPSECLYDHPPSTGSYRAAPLPEPPNIDPEPPEPLYDEIPPKHPQNLYINTCGSPRL